MFPFPAALSRRTDFLNSTALNPSAYGDVHSVGVVYAPPASLGRSFARAAAVASVTAMLTVTGAATAQAADFEVNAATYVTNGDPLNIIDGNDSLTITPNGSITVTGADGVVATNADNQIVNEGVVEVDGLSVDGIFVADDNNVINRGFIRTLGNRSSGMRAIDLSTLSNSGAITTSGDRSHGISFGSDNAITNSGSITTLGNNAYGIYAQGTNNSIASSGNISTTGDSSHGVFLLVHYNSLNNAGSIFVSGSNAAGIVADPLAGNISISNSGRIVSAQDHSLLFDNNGFANRTIDLSAPSFLGGFLDVGDNNNTTLNITTGPSHSVLWDFDPSEIVGGAPNVDGSVPWFYDPATGLFGTFDPSALAGSVEMLVDRSALVSSTMQGRLERAFGGAPSGTDAGRRISGAWINVIGSLSEYEGNDSTLDRDIAFGGVAGGFEVDLSSATRLGFVGGYLAGSAEAESRWYNAFETDEQGVFAGVFGQHQLNGTVFLTGSFAAGATFGSETTRFVNDNLQPLGESYAEIETDAVWIMKELGIGTEMDFASGWTVRPTANLRYAAEWRDGTTESGPSTAANAVIDDHMIAVGEARLAVAATRGFDLSSGMHGYLTGRAGVLGRMSLGDDVVSVTLPGISTDSQDISTGYEDSIALFGGLDASLMLSDIATLDLSTTATLGDNFLNLSGKAGLGMKF